MQTTRGDALFLEASRYYIGGAGAGGRFFPAIGRPLYVAKADGAYLYDVDGNKYIDYHTSSGATFLGYNNPAIRAEIVKALEIGYFCNFETEYHAALAKLICESVPCAEKVRFANSGTEATLAAIRLARAVTGRKKIIKFEGHFHGMHELAFFNCHTALPEIDRNGEIKCIPDTAGIPDEIASLVGCVLPNSAFVRMVREETTREGVILIFDEVLSGFRMCLGGGQEYLGVTPDLATLGKALGGSGIPIAALVGKDSVMQGLNPQGRTVMSGTYTSHILAVIASLKAMEIIRAPGFYGHMNLLADRLYSGLNEIFSKLGVKAVVQGLGARFGLYCGLETLPIYDYREVVRCFDFEMNQKFVRMAFDKQLYIHDYGCRFSPTHHGFTSAHSVQDVDETLQRCEDIFRALR
jgi:glutamate-1-semialdehyde 2,1-aminomutase